MKFSNARSEVFAIILFTFVFICLFSHPSIGQSLLKRTLTLNLEHTRVADVLDEMGKQGHFYFSYDGDLVERDSLVSISVKDETLSSVLLRLFQNRYLYTERRNYLIITPQLRRFALINTDITDEGSNYSISGIVADERTGERLVNASIYEKQQLAATLSDEHGYFRLKLKADYRTPIRLTVSKFRYQDTSINFLQAVFVNSHADNSSYKNIVHKHNRIEHTGWGDLFISTRQKIQSLNIPDFFAKRPFQVSLTPGLSTHGMFSPQVVNNFSLNLIGGYTAGVKGLEVGGLFNINKGDSKFLQWAGVFNLVGGNMTGLQFAGVNNVALDTLKGAQISLFINKAEEEVAGLQFSILHNTTRHLKGMQIGLINVADTSEGISFGLINIMHNGFYQLAYSVNKFAGTNISFKSGTHQFYTTLLFSANPTANVPLLAAGIGIGHDFMLNSRFYISAEANIRLPVDQTLEERWIQGKLMLNARITKHISLLAGPTFNKYSYIWSNPKEYTFDHNGNNFYELHQNSFKRNIGLEAGIAFNSVFKPLDRPVDHSKAWSTSIAMTAGVSDLSTYGQFIPGAEVTLYRDLGNGLSGLIATGYNRFPSNSDKNSVFKEENYNASAYDIIPVKTGVRYRLTPRFFIEGAVGEQFSSSRSYLLTNSLNHDIYDGNYSAKSSFMYSVCAGFILDNGIELGVKKEVYGLGNEQQYAFRLGYNFKW
ncbi:hypothetical protein [Mucilaginibacter jinjuensis]|uniref:Carboxypeptidase-like protein n=1 Tax=Mucilaginibacter jinjuensis TaxID=1176721 RepID=A0ABY7TDF7_9SPHI|nr:hypothetical protein [Mucilaginibacter jinjuensis]WCT14366.1 hypothetical protein PQO05_10520 [Mucilaginibacter jinjuensis]